MRSAGNLMEVCSAAPVQSQAKMAVHNRKYRALTDPEVQAGRALLALRVALGHHVRVPTCQPLIGANLPAPAEAQNGLQWPKLPQKSQTSNR